MALIKKWKCPECGFEEDGLPTCGSCGYKLIDYDAKPRTDAFIVEGRISGFAQSNTPGVWLIAFRYDALTGNPLEGQMTVIPSLITNEPPFKKGDRINITITKSKEEKY